MNKLSLEDLITLIKTYNPDEEENSDKDNNIDQF